ncbi:MAG: CinA family protein [Muribaculaceae bacterium]|nr:CinA family protein [Muribaculaceae bacterium]
MDPYILQDLNEIAPDLLDTLRQSGLTLSTAESCTGGNIAHHLTLVAGCSDVYNGGVVTYSNSAKAHILGVAPDVIAQHGAVSEQVVRAMAEGACRAFHTDCAMATSGIAGPGGGSDEKPVGTVWTAVVTPAGTFAELYHLAGPRSEIIDKATLLVMRLLLNKL